MCTSDSFRLPITPSTLPIYVSPESIITDPRAGQAPEYDTSKPPSWLTLSTLPLNITRPRRSAFQCDG